VNLDLERRNLKCQAIWISISLCVFITQNIVLFFSLALDYSNLQEISLVVYIATMMPRDIFPLVFMIHSHHQNFKDMIEI